MQGNLVSPVCAKLLQWWLTDQPRPQLMLGVAQRLADQTLLQAFMIQKRKASCDDFIPRQFLQSESLCQLWSAYSDLAFGRVERRQQSYPIDATFLYIVLQPLLFTGSGGWKTHAQG